MFLRERIDRAWANIEVSLKKRRDLIPGLEERRAALPDPRASSRGPDRHAHATRAVPCSASTRCRASSRPRAAGHAPARPRRGQPRAPRLGARRQGRRRPGRRRERGRPDAAGLQRRPDLRQPRPVLPRHRSPGCSPSRHGATSSKAPRCDADRGSRWPRPTTEFRRPGGLRILLRHASLGRGLPAQDPGSDSDQEQEPGPEDGPEAGQTHPSCPSTSSSEQARNEHLQSVAELLAPLPADLCWKVLRCLTSATWAWSSRYSRNGPSSASGASASSARVAEIVSSMPHDDRVDFLEALPKKQKAQILRILAQNERDDILRLASYEEGTAGAIMTSEYAVVTPDLSVKDALAKVRYEAPDKETIYYVYVVDAERRLAGITTLKDLVLALPKRPVRDVMWDATVTVQVDEDQEEVAQKIEKYDLIAVPVLDGAGRLVGIVTHDDALDVLVEEVNEDADLFVGIAGDHDVNRYLRTGPIDHFRKRIGWLVGLLLLGLASGFVMRQFAGLLDHFVILTLFMPMIAATGGNAGGQSTSVILRALSTKEIRPRDFGRVFLKELRVALLLGLVLGTVAVGNFFIVAGSAAEHVQASVPLVAACVAIALCLQVVTSTLIGASFPILATRLGFDAAVVAGPAITTFVDITGLLIYFNVARTLLGI
ncbi:MAG: magnesium transporter [Planctomycetota bacterium]